MYNVSCSSHADATLLSEAQQEFYAKAAEATAFVQAEPEIFDSPYKGMGAEGGGVVGMLEVSESDFARLESDTKAPVVTGKVTLLEE